MNIQPKPYLENIKLRHHSIGNERRRNMSKIILEHGTPLPQPITYEDIDKTFQEWAENKMTITYDGILLPTFRLFSNQRINEYAQTWKYLDDNGNVLMNFKTITRDNNPNKGESQGNNFNIPGNRDYPMFIVPTLQENGQEAIDLYSMKQPFAVDFVYSLNIVTNKYELLNEFSELMQNEFKALQSYITPNGHPMPMMLESISDDSEYALEDRKYYSQSFKIKIHAYIIRKEDFTITRLPSRTSIRMIGMDNLDKDKPKITIEDEDIDDCCLHDNEDRYYNKIVKVIINLPMCVRTAKFTIDTNMVLTTVETDNIYDFIVKVNEEVLDFDNEIKIYDGDEISVEIERDDIMVDSVLRLIGYDPDVVIDKNYNPESSLDDIFDEEEIIINQK